MPPNADHPPEQAEPPPPEERLPRQEELFAPLPLMPPSDPSRDEFIASGAAQPETEDLPETHPEELAPEDELASEPITDWKEALRHDFERWLETIQEIPADSPEDADETDGPDLYSFYEQLAASNIEARKANRRTAEAMSQWGEILGRFDGDLGQLRQYFTQISAQQEGLPRGTCLVLVEILDRMHRLARAFESPPQQSWWTKSAAWPQAWKTQREGFDILVSHLASFLKKQGVTRIETAGKPFDPVIMVAVATESDPERPHHTVIEEVAPGYRHGGELLRPAQVKVTVSPGSQT